MQIINIDFLIDRYDYFFVDLWGVIHDGMYLYPKVVETLNTLKTNNKNIIFISNAPRRAKVAQKKLDDLKITTNLYKNIITSGECVFDYIKNSNYKLGKNYFIIGPTRDDGLLKDLPDYNFVTNIADADFLIVTGYDNDNSNIDEKLPYLEAGLENNLPLLCANPDLEVVRQDGTRALCAGIIANQYIKMGGKVTQFGKPYNIIYEKALNLLNISDKSKIIGIGDSLITDIKGANNFNIDSAIVAGGILAETLGPDINLDILNNLCKEESVSPTYIMKEFS